MIFKGLVKKKDRRKNHKLRKAIDDNQKAAEEVKGLVKEFTATVNGDLDWMKRSKLKRKEDTNDGCSSGDLLSDSC